MKRIEKAPVTSESLNLALTVISFVLDNLGLNKIANVSHYGQLFRQSIERAIFGSEHSVVPKNLDDTYRSRFIAIFKTRYLQLCDLEYDSIVTPAEARLIPQTCALLAEKGFEIDDYLRWIFESFLPENPKFHPPEIKVMCSSFVFHKFLFENKDLLKKKNDEEIRKKESLDLINRARALIRLATTPEQTEKLKNLMRNFRDERIMIRDLRVEIENYEAASLVSTRVQMSEGGTESSMQKESGG